MATDQRVLDLGATVLVGRPVAELGPERAEQAARRAWSENSRVVPEDRLGGRDPFTAALLDAWLECLEDEASDDLFEWSARTLETTRTSVRLAPAGPYPHRDDPAPSERPMVRGTGRIGPPPDIGPIKRELYDPRLGGITNVFRDLSSSTVALVGVEFRYAGTVVSSFGRGASFEAAERVAVLEMLERRAVHAVEGVMSRGPYVPGARDQLDPRTLLGFQVPADDTPDRVEYRDGEPIRWIRGWDYRAARAVDVPLQAVEIGLVDEPRYLAETSNGAALGSSLSEARLFALLELIERDAFLVFWGARVVLDRIDHESLPGDVRSLIEDNLVPGRRIEVYDLTFDVAVPTVLCLIRDEQGPVHTYLSTSAHVVPEMAVRLAVHEAVVGREIFATNPTIRNDPMPIDADVVEMFDHVRRGASPEFIPQYDFLSTSRTVRYETWSARYRTRAEGTADDVLRELVGGIAERHRVIFVDATSAVTHRHGLYVAKAIVPDFLPMTFGHRHRRMNWDRVTEAVTGSAYASMARFDETERRRHDDPHPFP